MFPFVKLLVQLIISVSFVTSSINSIEGEYRYAITYRSGNEMITLEGTSADSNTMKQFIRENCEIRGVRIESKTNLRLPPNTFLPAMNGSCERFCCPRIEIYANMNITIEERAFDNMDYLARLVLSAQNKGTVGGFSGLNVNELALVGFSNMNFSNVHRLDDLNVTESSENVAYVWDSNSTSKLHMLVLKTNYLKQNHMQSSDLNLGGLSLHSQHEGSPLLGLADNIDQFSCDLNNMHSISLSKCFDPNVLQIDFVKLFPKLYSLKLNSNGISNLETSNASFFKQAKQLKWIELKDNMIEEIPPNYFEFKYQVSKLDLTGNPITKIYPNSFGNISILSMSLADNAKIDLFALLPIFKESYGYRRGVVSIYFEKLARKVTFVDKLTSDQSINGSKLNSLTIFGNDEACPTIPNGICKYIKRVHLSNIPLPCVRNLDSELHKTMGFSNNVYHILCRYA